ncbi:MAG: glycoside hydrolase family 15 protein, partial [Nitrososphaerales archaeon]
AGHLLDHETGILLSALADRCCDAWLSKDSGIWELERQEHYTISKIGCWVALDRAARLADVGQLPGHHTERWRSEAADVKRWIDTNCWSEARGSYTFYSGTDDLDAAVLLAGRTGFERGPRLASTVEAVVSELSRGPHLYRYSGMEKEEGAFVACTFWLVSALVHVGQVDRARGLMEEAVRLTNDVGLFSEQIDPLTGEFLGNFPQGLSHLSLINAAHALGRVGTDS